MCDLNAQYMPLLKNIFILNWLRRSIYLKGLIFSFYDKVSGKAIYGFCYEKCKAVYTSFF